jgi:hypothetical protein
MKSSTTDKLLEKFIFPNNRVRVSGCVDNILMKHYAWNTLVMWDYIDTKHYSKIHKLRSATSAHIRK